MFNGKNGIQIKSVTGEFVPLSKLSSGEQNLIILYYFLVFKTKNNIILLVDEPENSLHVGWVNTLADDYIKISARLNCQVILATHSPTLIADHWDLVNDLYELNKAIDKD